MSCGFRAYLELSIAHVAGERGKAAQAALRLPQLDLRPSAIAGKVDDKTVSVIARLHHHWTTRHCPPDTIPVAPRSKHFGVSWDKVARAWRARGIEATFQDDLEASRAYRAAQEAA